MFSKIKKFSAEEAGAVAVEWMVLSAAFVGLCVGAIDTVHGGVNNLASALEQGISTKSVDAEQ